MLEATEARYQLNTESNGDKFPAGLENAFIFSAFNALSFQLILGSPMILFAKSLEASATVLGIISGMMPLLVICQIPAANHVHKYGYKKFVFAGWGTRVMFIFVMASVPLFGRFLGNSGQLMLILFLLFCFNLSRGISSCAWLPWITSLLTTNNRGKYLAREAAFVNFASAATLLFAAGCLGDQPQSWQFSVVFTVSALMGAISLFYLKQIPDTDTPEQIRASSTPVPWLEIAGYRPFRKLLFLGIAWSIAYGGLNAFTVSFLKTEAAMSERYILIVNSVAFLGGIATHWLFGSRIDRLGSKPVIAFALLLWLAIVFGWGALAGKLINTSISILLLLQVLMGFGAALVSMANTRLAMVIVPTMGKNHFFALFSVVGNLVLGMAPILWGVVIDLVGPTEFHWHSFEWNRFSIFFGLVACAFVIALFFCKRLEEPNAARVNEVFRQVLFDPPQRIWIRVSGRAAKTDG